MATRTIADNPSLQKRVRKEKARKHKMQSTRSAKLEEFIADLLQQRLPAPMTIPQIETEVAKAEDVEADTFDVRDAVWRLVADGRAEFTSKMYVKATSK
jgi:hypothetical protein